MALLTGEQLQARYGVPTMSGAHAAELAAAAQNAIEAEVGPVEAAEDVDLEMEGTWSHRLVIPRRPLTAVTAASIDGVALSQAEIDEIRVRGYGVAVRPEGRHWGGSDVTVEVTVDHGFAVVPGWMVDLAADIARRAASNPAQVVQETAGPFSVSHGTSTLSVRLTRAERAVLRRRMGLGVGHF